MVIFAAIAAATVFSPISAHAGEPIKAEVGTDIVSSYLWRGSRLDGPAFQPTVERALTQCLGIHGLL